MTLSDCIESSKMKVGDLVRFRVRLDHLDDGEEVGMIVDISEPTPMFSMQVAVVVFDTRIFEGILTRTLEVVSEVSETS